LMAVNSTIALYATNGNRNPVLPMRELMEKCIAVRALVLFALPTPLLAAAQADISKWLAGGTRIHNIAAQFALSETAQAPPAEAPRHFSTASDARSRRFFAHFRPIFDLGTRGGRAERESGFFPPKRPGRPVSRGASRPCYAWPRGSIRSWRLAAPCGIS